MSNFSVKTGFSIAWHFLEILLSKGVHIITTLLLAWFLVPEDYALVAILTLFIALSNVLVDAGFSQALIREKNVTDRQLTTSFTVSLAIALFVYGVFYVCAPLIAHFYEEPKLINLLRVVSLTLFFNAFILVPKVLLQRDLAFKNQLQVMLPATILAALISLIAARAGLGVWSLILQIVLQAFIVCLLFYFKKPWKIRIGFDKSVFLKLWSFSRFIIINELASIPLKNIYLITLPKFFASQLVGLYFFASKVQEMLTYLLTEAIQNVTYPALSKIRDNPTQLLAGYRKVMTSTTFIMFPAMLFLAAVAPLVFELVLPEKWHDAAQYIQIMAISGIFYPLAAINLSILKVVGAGKLLFYIGLFKGALLLLILSITLQFDTIKIIIWGHMVAAFLGYMPNAWYANKLIGYSIPFQLKDVGINLALAGIIAFFMYFIVNHFQLDSWLELILTLLSGTLIYIGLAFILKIQAIQNLVELAKKMLVRP